MKLTEKIIREEIESLASQRKLDRERSVDTYSNEASIYVEQDLWRKLLNRFLAHPLSNDPLIPKWSVLLVSEISSKFTQLAHKSYTKYKSRLVAYRNFINKVSIYDGYDYRDVLNQ